VQGHPEGQARSEVDRLLEILPQALEARLRALGTEGLVEIVLDLGRRPEARFLDRGVPLSDDGVTEGDLEQVIRRIGEFGDDNRAGIEGTLHRISAIRNRRGRIIGLTLRVGRAVSGTVQVLRDLVETGLNLLILGRPGVGKTTLLREVARVLADEVGKRVIVIDTSNEIAGDGDVPHPGIGGARRMQVPRPEKQHAVMIEAVENHMPEVIIVDEIGTGAETAAARTIAERGVQLVGTAHGNTLENLVLNPTLSDLVGGVQTVVLSDEEARRRGTSKTITERRSPPTFDIVVEMASRDELLVHREVAGAVDRLLQGREMRGERRRITGQGTVEVEEVTEQASASSAAAAATAAGEGELRGASGPRRICGYGLSRDLVERALRDLGVDARVVGRLESADAVIALRSRAGDPRLERYAVDTGARVLVIKHDTAAQIRRALRDLFTMVEGLDPEQVREAVEEVEQAIERVLSERVMVELLPRRPALRKVQHRIAARYHLVAESVGSEPQRHLVIRPAAA